jgi:hypothetical protein
MRSSLAKQEKQLYQYGFIPTQTHIHVYTHAGESEDMDLDGAVPVDWLPRPEVLLAYDVEKPESSREELPKLPSENGDTYSHQIPAASQENLTDFSLFLLNETICQAFFETAHSRVISCMKSIKRRAKVALQQVQDSAATAHRFFIARMRHFSGNTEENKKLRPRAMQDAKESVEIAHKSAQIGSKLLF